MILLRLLSWFRPPVPTPDALAGLAHLIVLGLALTLFAQGEGRPALTVAPAEAHVR